jgi:hypothetical protein
MSKDGTCEKGTALNERVLSCYPGTVKTTRGGADYNAVHMCLTGGYWGGRDDTEEDIKSQIELEIAVERTLEKLRSQMVENGRNAVNSTFRS